MKLKKGTLLFLLLTCLAYTTLAQTDYELQGSDVTIDDKGIITGCTCRFDSKSIIIPVQIGDITITGIGDEAFKEKSLVAVVFETESQVVSIGNSAFRDNSITTLFLPTTLTSIGKNAFSGNTVELNNNGITLPKHAKGEDVTYKDSNDQVYEPGDTFTNFDRSLDIVIPPSYTLTADDVTVDDGIITKCFLCEDEKFVNKRITIPVKIDGEIITGIFSKSWPNKGVFGYKNFAAVAFEEGSQITYIGDYAFSNNQITEFTLPTTLKTIGNSAFANNKITKLTFPADTQLTTIGNYAFLNSSFSFILPSVTIEGYRAYWKDGNSADLGTSPTINYIYFAKSFELDSIKQVTLTTAVAEQQGGMITRSVEANDVGKDMYDINTEVTLTAEHNTGWRFDKWVISDEQDKTDKTTTITLNTDKSVTAYFVEVITLTVEVNNEEGGSIEPSDDHFVIDKADAPSTQVLTATPNEGWRFDKWVISDEQDKTDETTTITLDADKTATAHFVQLVTLTTVVAEQQGGTIARSVEPNNDGEYDINTEVTLTATPNEGWKFDKWEISDEEDKTVTNPITLLTLDKNKSVTAHFVEEEEEEEEAITSILTEIVSANPYPNPVTSQITLKAKDGDLIQLFSQKGKQQYSAQHTGNEVHTIDVSALPVGVYLVRITDAEENTTTKRILKK